jgi:CRP-like cAMP-binding protein
VVLAWPGLRGIDRRAEVPVRAIALLRRMRLFEALDAPTIEFLARTATWVTVPAGTIVIREGDPGDRFYVIEAGKVSVSREGAPVRTLDAPGDGFGEIALLRDIPRTATVTALKETVMLALGRREFLAAVTGTPAVSQAAGNLVDAQLLADRGVGAG